ncbi:MAG: O-antigen ligase family protein [Clostridium sartagoforme]|nr:O-antigen ligase family protein [Clostridium sartagoforme]
MLLKVLLYNVFFNVFVLFINTSISDALFEKFYINPSIISITRLFINLIFILLMVYYILTKRIKLRIYEIIIIFILFVGGSILLTPEKFEAIKVYINFIGLLSYFIVLFNIIDKDRVVLYLKNYADLLVFFELLTIFIFRDIGYMANSNVISGIHLSRSTLIIYLNLCIFIYLYYLYFFKKLNNRINKIVVFTIFICVFLIVLSRSSTGILIIALFLPVLLWIKDEKRANLLLMFSSIFSVLLPIINFNSPLLNSIIGDVFHKNISFSGRRYIWDYAIGHFSNNFLIGNGFNSIDSLFRGKVIPTYDRVAAHSHNGFLEVFLQNGLIGLILILIIIIIFFRSINLYSSFEIRLLKTYIIIFIIFNSMEPYLLQTVSGCTFWLIGIFIIVYNKRSKERINE